MRYFLDTEFHDRPSGTELISLALVANDGREFYAISSEYDHAAAAANPWLAEHVLPHLTTPGAPAPTTNAQIAADLAEFCSETSDGRKPQVWAWNGTYDFYLLAKLYGRLLDIPKDVPSAFYDLKQWARQLGNVTVPAQAGGEHDALHDARHDRDAWNFLAQHEINLRTRRDERIRTKLLAALTQSLKNAPIS